MAAVSRSCLHICQEVTVQEKMGSLVCCFPTSFFSKPACAGDGWCWSSHCSIIFVLKCFVQNTFNVMAVMDESFVLYVLFRELLKELFSRCIVTILKMALKYRTSQHKKGLHYWDHSVLVTV